MSTTLLTGCLSPLAGENRDPACVAVKWRSVERLDKISGYGAVASAHQRVRSDSARCRGPRAVVPSARAHGLRQPCDRHLLKRNSVPVQPIGPVTPFSATNAMRRSWSAGRSASAPIYAITGNLRMRGEYRFSDYSNYNTTCGNPANIAISTTTASRAPTRHCWC